MEVKKVKKGSLSKKVQAGDVVFYEDEDLYYLVVQEMESEKFRAVCLLDGLLSDGEYAVQRDVDNGSAILVNATLAIEE